MQALTELDKRRIRQSFSAASGSYDGLAELQRHVALELSGKMARGRRWETIVDIGCGTGFFTRHAVSRCECVKLLAMDIALPMLQTARRNSFGKNLAYLCGDAEQLPLAAESIDKIVSNLALQWCQALPAVFADFRRALKPGGQLAFSTFGPATLQELKAAWAVVDDYTHVNTFYSLGQIEQFLKGAGFEVVLAESNLRQSYYSSVMDLMKELKGIGAHNVTAGRNRQLTTRSQLQRMMEAYPLEEEGQRISASYEILYIAAVKK